MINSTGWIVRYGLAAVLVAALAATMACSSTSSTASVPPLTSPAPSVASPSPTRPAATPTPGVSQRQGSSGTLTKIDGNTLTLTTTQGQVTVIASSSTSVQKTIKGMVSDLHEGQQLTVVGTPDANGNITATSIVVRSQSLATPPSPPAGTTPNPSGRPARPGNSGTPGSRGGTGRFVTGTLSKVDGNLLTLTTAQGQATVSVGTTTTIQETVAGALSDLRVGDSLTVAGTRDANNNITAGSIIIRLQGQSVPAGT